MRIRAKKVAKACPAIRRPRAPQPSANPRARHQAPRWLLPPPPPHDQRRSSTACAYPQEAHGLRKPAQRRSAIGRCLILPDIPSATKRISSFQIKNLDLPTPSPILHLMSEWQEPDQRAEQLAEKARELFQKGRLKEAEA
ncbi:MAG: hypothetical protein EBT08_18615, partial [Betaproteobacteria bacterium]|nr:hypothetical protein [Betaproteobacteria bacterium]